MGFLKKLGQILLKATVIAVGLTPLAPTKHQGTVGTMTDKLLEIQRVIVNVEAFGQVLSIAGPDKAKAAGPAVAQIILSSAIVGDKKIEDPALFLEGCTELGGALAKIMNSLDDEIKTINHA